MVINRIVFSLLLLLLSETAFCQVVAIQNDQMNVLYIGMHNPVTVAVEGYKSKDILVTTNNGQIEKDYDSRPGHYVIVPTKPGIAEVYIYLKKQKENKKIGSVVFRVNRIPLPQARLGWNSGGEISQSRLINQIAPIASFCLAESGMCGQLPIVKFTVEIFRRGKEIFRSLDADTSGARIDSTTYSFFHNRLKKNDKVIFKDMAIKDFDGMLRDLDPLEFTISEAHKIRKLKVPDTTIVVDPITGQEMMKITTER